MSCFTLSLKSFSSDSDSCSAVGMGPSLQFPRPPRAGPVLLTLLFFPLVPSSYRVLRASVCSFPLVRSPCSLSAGVLCALLCLRVNSWCICADVLHVHLPLCDLILPVILKESVQAAGLRSSPTSPVPVWLAVSWKCWWPWSSWVDKTTACGLTFPRWTTEDGRLEFGASLEGWLFGEAIAQS